MIVTNEQRETSRLPGRIVAILPNLRVRSDSMLPRLLRECRCAVRDQLLYYRLPDQPYLPHNGTYGLWSYRDAVRGHEAVVGLRDRQTPPATLRELIAFVETNPLILSNDAVLGAGTVTRDRRAVRRVPCYHVHGGRRTLTLDFYDAVFDPCWLFLVRLPAAGAPA